MALRVAGSRVSVMLSQENSAKEYGGYGFPGGFAVTSDVLVLLNSNSWWMGWDRTGLAGVQLSPESPPPPHHHSLDPMLRHSPDSTSPPPPPPRRLQFLPLI